MDKTQGVTLAVLNLVKNAVFTIAGESIISWEDKRRQPTEAEIAAEVIRLQAEYDAQEYARLRKEEYPSIEDQLDTIYHSGLDVWCSKIKEVKDKFPKGDI